MTRNYCKIPVYNKQERLLVNMLRKPPVGSKFNRHRVYKLRSLPSGIATSKNTMDVFGAAYVKDDGNIRIRIIVVGRAFHRDIVSSALDSILPTYDYNSEITATDRNIVVNPLSFPADLYGDFYDWKGTESITLFDSNSPYSREYIFLGGVSYYWRYTVCEAINSRIERIDVPDSMSFSFSIKTDLNVSFLNWDKGGAGVIDVGSGDSTILCQDLYNTSGERVIGNDIEPILNTTQTVVLGSNGNAEQIAIFGVATELSGDYPDGSYFSLEVSPNTSGISMLRSKCTIDVTNPSNPIVSHVRENDPDSCFEFDDLDWVPVSGGNFSLPY